MRNSDLTDDLRYEEAKPILGRRTMYEFIETFYDNSVKNMGNHDSFFWYGPR